MYDALHYEVPMYCEKSKYVNYRCGSRPSEISDFDRTQTFEFLKSYICTFDQIMGT